MILPCEEGFGPIQLNPEKENSELLKQCNSFQKTAIQATL